MMNPSSHTNKRNAPQVQKTEYNYDMVSPYDYFNKTKTASTASTSNYGDSSMSNNKIRWYENEEYHGKFVYKIEKSIPAVV